MKPLTNSSLRTANLILAVFCLTIVPVRWLSGVHDNSGLVFVGGVFFVTLYDYFLFWVRMESA